MDKNTFTTKVLECEETLYRISISMLRNEQDCEDAVQETVLAAYSNLSSLRNEAYFKSWLVRILINNCNKQLKYRNKNIVSDTFPDSPISSDNQMIEMRSALDALTPKIRIVVVMYYVEGFSVKEIKNILKIPEGTVKSRLSKGRSLLASELKP